MKRENLHQRERERPQRERERDQRESERERDIKERVREIVRLVHHRLPFGIGVHPRSEHPDLSGAY
jgi:hypothetical protein